MESEWPWFALVSDAPLRVDQINTVGPAGVDTLGGIAEIVEDRRKLYAQLSHAGPSDVSAFFFVLWAGKKYLVLKVVLALPDVGRMGFLYVHHKKGHSIPILCVELV